MTISPCFVTEAANLTTNGFWRTTAPILADLGQAKDHNSKPAA